MIRLGDENRQCIFCGQDLEPDQIAWLIDEKLLRGVPLSGEQSASALSPADNVFWDALNRFSRPDRKGTAFYLNMSGKLAPSERVEPEQVQVVLPGDFEDPASDGKTVNTYTTEDNREIQVFRRPDTEKDKLYLRFTEEFVAEMQRLGFTSFDSPPILRYIEEECIKPVCPECMSYLPRELLDKYQQDVYVVRLAYIGPPNSGKTTLNWTNLVHQAFSRGGWIQSSKNLFSTTHYKARNYYEDQVRLRRIPMRTQKEEYTPPLIVRLRRDNKILLLSLTDIAGELLQQIYLDSTSGTMTPQTYAYVNMLERMDGFLLMIDSKTEILSKTNANTAMDGDQRGQSAATLYDLVKCFSGFYEMSKKPAALLLTKCDMLFQKSDDSGMMNQDYKTLFHMFSQTEKAFWQQPEDPHAAVRTCYAADYHECIQMPFKAFIQYHFPQLWTCLNSIFSRFDVFPEASLGIDRKFQPDESVDLAELKPFHTAAPFFWLLDVIGFDPPEKA